MQCRFMRSTFQIGEVCMASSPRGHSRELRVDNGGACVDTTWARFHVTSDYIGRLVQQPGLPSRHPARSPAITASPASRAWSAMCMSAHHPCPGCRGGVLWVWRAYAGISLAPLGRRCGKHAKRRPLNARWFARWGLQRIILLKGKFVAMMPQ